MESSVSGIVDRHRFVDYFSELGRRPVIVDGGVWYETGPTFMQRFPFHEVVSQGSSPGRELFQSRRVQAARFGRVPEAGSSGNSALWVRREPYTIDSVSSNARSKIRRGLKRTSVERVSFSDLRDAALPLLASTALRQRVRFGAKHSDSWQKLCDTASRHDMMEAWAGRVDGNLAIFAVCFEVENCFQISTVRSDSEQLSNYPNNALLHTLMEEAQNREHVDTLCYGLASLDRGTSGLDDFKRRAGFDAEPIDDVIVARHPVAAAGMAGRLLSRVEDRNHRLAQLSTIASTVRWWRTDAS